MTHAWRRIALLGALYFVQGLPFGFQAHALKLYLRAHGRSLAEIGFASALALPWLAKPLWAPLVDRFGRRQSWIIPMQLGLAATCGAAALVPPERALGLLLALVFLMNLFAATQDIAVDGLAIDLLGPAELGPGNAAQVVGYKAGMLMSGGVLVWATSSIGWPGLFAAMAVLVLGALLVVLAVPHADRPAVRARERQSLGAIVRTVAAALRLPGGGLLLLAVASYKLGESMVDSLWTVFLFDSGYTAARLGAWAGTWGMAASTVGSLLGGALAVRLGVPSALGLAASVRVLPLAVEWLLSQGMALTDGWVLGVTIAEHFAGGVLTVAMFAFMMSRVDRRVGATHYALLTTVEVAGKLPAVTLSGLLAELLGYSPVFAVGVALSVAFLALLRPLRLSPASNPPSSITQSPAESMKKG